MMLNFVTVGRPVGDPENIHMFQLISHFPEKEVL